VAAVAALPVRSCLIDGEAIVSDEAGLAVFELIRSRRPDADAVLCAFDLLELDGEDLRRLPVEARKAGFAQLLRKPSPGIALNEHYVGHGDIVYQQACKLGCEGIVSKRLGSLYCSGRSKHWVKVKNPAAPDAKLDVRYDLDSGAKANIAALHRARRRYWVKMAYFAALAAFSINAATSCACERKIAWLPGSSMTCDWARFAMNRSRSGLIIRSCLETTA
jgi:bifunctional non-homologous end joining protein LigD